MQDSSLNILLIILLIFLGYQWIANWKKYRKIYGKYKDLVDYDEELEKRKKQIESIKSDQTKLNQEYTGQKNIFNNLQKEIGILEETIDMHSYGLYKPHFDFANSEEYKFKLDETYELQKLMIKDEKAAMCTTKWNVQGSEAKGRKMTKEELKLMLRAFNGECDAAIAKVKWNNATIMEERIKKAFEAINKLGETNTSFISHEYLNLKLQELYLVHEHEEKLNKEKEKQREIKEQLHEEEKVRKELEKAQKDAENDEIRHQKALEEAKLELEKVEGEKREKLNQQILILEQQLKEAQEKKARAISQAQLTKAGHVYVISNIGSFGENVFKIGMTRRLDPMDRIRELGDASVPFIFDVHALIYSEDAPDLECKLQNHFEKKRINLVNDRKEFFNVTIDEIDNFAKENNMNLQIIKVAEAREYRETQAMKANTKESAAIQTQEKFPETLFKQN